MSDEVFILIQDPKFELVQVAQEEIVLVEVSGQKGDKGDKGDAIAIDGQLSIPYSPSVQINLAANSLSGIFDITLTGNITINFSNPVKSGQKVMLRLTQDAVGGRTVSFGTTIRVGTSLATFAATNTPLKMDILGFVFNATAGKFDFVGVNKGY